VLENDGDQDISCEKLSITQGQKERKMEHTIKRRKTNWTGHILRRNSLLKHVTGGNIEGMRKRGKRYRQIRMTLRKRHPGILRKKH
jgi:hypothetical protein